jgi:hypothetical protein
MDSHTSSPQLPLKPGSIENTEEGSRDTVITEAAEGLCVLINKSSSSSPLHLHLHLQNQPSFKFKRSFSHRE